MWLMLEAGQWAQDPDSEIILFHLTGGLLWSSWLCCGGNKRRRDSSYPFGCCILFGET